MENIVYLEYIDEKSNKFWQIEWNETSYTITFGKIGTTGQSKTTESSDVKTEVDKLVASKKKKGYCSSDDPREPIVSRSYNKNLDIIYNSLNVSDEDVVYLDKFAKVLFNNANVRNGNVLFSFILGGTNPSEIIGSEISDESDIKAIDSIEEEMKANNYTLDTYAGFNDWDEGFSDFMDSIQYLVNKFDPNLELETKNFFNPNKVEGFNEKYEDKDEDFFYCDIEYDEDEEEFYGDEGVFTFLDGYSNLKKVGYSVIDLPSDGDNILYTVVRLEDAKKFTKALVDLEK